MVTESLSAGSPNTRRTDSTDDKDVLTKSNHKPTLNIPFLLLGGRRELGLYFGDNHFCGNDGIRLDRDGRDALANEKLGELGIVRRGLPAAPIIETQNFRLRAGHWASIIIIDEKRQTLRCRVALGSIRDCVFRSMRKRRISVQG